MILDTVLEEQSFDKDEMIEIFMEGYHAALDVIENGLKFKDIEEMTETLEYTALVCIEEIKKEKDESDIKEVGNKAKKVLDKNNVKTNFSNSDDMRSLLKAKKPLW